MENFTVPRSKKIGQKKREGNIFFSSLIVAPSKDLKAESVSKTENTNQFLV
jgi:hypothetical protein